MRNSVAHSILEADEQVWYAIYTIVRHEKSVNLALSNQDIETFLPIRQVVNRWKDRKKKVDIPLFPGYLFVNLSPENRLKILNTRGVVKMLGVNGFPTPVPNEQIESIKRLMETDLCYDPCPYLCEGKEVIVNNGPLEGMKGKILERRGEYRLILSVDLINRSISVEVDINDVELS